MYVTNIKKSVAGCLLIITSFLLLAVSVLGADQELKTMKLVGTYQSKEEMQAAYPEQFPFVEKISPNGDSFRLAVPQKERLKTFKIESLTETERQALQTSNKAKPVIKTGTMRWLSNDRTMLFEADVTVKVRESGSLHEGDVNTKNLTLYNARGEVVTHLSPEVNMLAVSPDRQYFVAYNWKEYGEPAVLYFYAMDGTLFQKQDIIHFAQVRYSQNGEFVQVYSDMEQEFSIFTKTGVEVYQGNRKELIKHVRPILHGVFTSEQGEWMLLATSQHIHLYTTQGEHLWTNTFPGFDVADCWFFSSQEKIALKTISNRSGENRYNVQIHSLQTGDILDTIIGVNDITVHNNHLIVIKGEQFYDYQIQ